MLADYVTDSNNSNVLFCYLVRKQMRNNNNVIVLKNSNYLIDEHTNIYRSGCILLAPPRSVLLSAGQRAAATTHGHHARTYDE
jgi:hypothetical protein